jgi:hypothetical protein
MTKSTTVVSADKPARPKSKANGLQANHRPSREDVWEVAPRGRPSGRRLRGTAGGHKHDPRPGQSQERNHAGQRGVSFRVPGRADRQAHQLRGGTRSPKAKAIRKALTANGPRMFEAAEPRAIVDKCPTPTIKAMALLAANSGMDNNHVGLTDS